MSRRYPGYDVQSKRGGPSWNDATRQVVDARLAVPREPRFLDAAQWSILRALCACVVPQPHDRPEVPVAALIDARLLADQGDGYRDARLPPFRQAWCIGLAALDAEALDRHAQGFATLSRTQQEQLLADAQAGELVHPAWQGMPSRLFFSLRLAHDITAAYYRHPVAWNELGFGGPAAPRGYVRLGANHRDAWESAEARPGTESRARELNRHVR
ncbi:gluconate 2-dehydrogenase subunit 3 family protein [Pseudomonas sp. gcc21]|uniref:gluconate 2-dehydrogenase subunit 3 family protein n=1 Tax=Pseudomonas sp. gcc21 TaxID=2726989 RepID=UPI0014524F18|nr:gluconate 2-dehydrogenase subunit 3 family protein [Pseudomonas sp. gcc21]QJD59821.1 gluconate 2-dehydrogenase subunit 3 family protein [Pseudomonas sp. gcc21]